MSIAFKEGINIRPPALNEIILASNQDVRQVKREPLRLSHRILHSSPLPPPPLLSSGDAQPEHVVGHRQGDVIRPVQVRRCQGSQRYENGSIRRLQKGICCWRGNSPHEPHRQVRPLLPRLLASAALCPRKLPERSSSSCWVRKTICMFLKRGRPFSIKACHHRGNLKSHLMLLSKAADSISEGDLVDRRIRSGQNWSLLPTQVTHPHNVNLSWLFLCWPAFVCRQAIYASVLPGELMRGYMSQFPSFPSWLGKNSSAGKHSRIVQELASHMSLKLVL